jgi:hypothetical protein
MDEETKSSAYKKLDVMKQVIAYPEELIDSKKMDEFHKDLVKDFDSVAENAGFLKKRLVINRFVFDHIALLFSECEFTNTNIADIGPSTPSGVFASPSSLATGPKSALLWPTLFTTLRKT